MQTVSLVCTLVQMPFHARRRCNAPVPKAAILNPLRPSLKASGAQGLSAATRAKGLLQDATDLSEEASISVP